MKNMQGPQLFQGIITSKSFGAIIENSCTDESGLDKARGLGIYQFATLVLSRTLCDLHLKITT